MELRLSADQLRHVAEFGSRHAVAEIALVVVGVDVAKHGSAVRETFAPFGEAVEIRAGGVTFVFVFAEPRDATVFSLRLQRNLRRRAPGEEGPAPDLCLGMHMCSVSGDEAGESRGLPELIDEGVTIAHRVMELAQRGQILATRRISDRARADTPKDAWEELGTVTWLSHGPYRARGIAAPFMLFEVGEEGEAAFAPPKDSEAAHRFLSPVLQPVLGWRPARGLQVPGSQWVLEERLGEGTFGETWVARDTEHLEESRVLKFCFRAERVHALRHEDAALRAITEHLRNHPRTVGVRAFHFDAPPYHIETDHVPAVDLAKWCSERGSVAQVPVEVRLEIISQVAEGLEAGHRRGILHLNLKPSNILVQGSGESAEEVRVRLTDFGVGQITARGVLGEAAVESLGDAVSREENASQTETRLRMAPEIRAGRPATTRSDIHSLGVLLHQLLVGDLRRPLPADWHATPGDWLLRLVVGRCVASDPEERFGSAIEAAVRIRDLPTQRALIRRVVTTAAVVLAVCLLAGVVWVLRPRRQITIQLPGGNTLEMVRIPIGSFEMGSQETESGRDPDEGPLHSVSLDGFHMGIHEVTVGQYRSFLVATGHPEPPYWSDQLQHPSLPVTWTDWQDAMAFCRWLSWSQEGAFSLPSEAQWEYACRAGTVSPFAFGVAPDAGEVNFDLGEAQTGGSASTVRPVGQGAANRFGLFDMHGNVREWCRDWYDPGFYAVQTAPQRNPANETPAERRVVRGGSWATLAEDCRSANRDGALPGARDPTLGFRVIRTEE